MRTHSLSNTLSFALLTSLTVFAVPAGATEFVVFNGFAPGIAAFNAAVTGSGGTVTNTVLTPGTSGNPLALPGFTISRNNGGTVSVGNPYTLFRSSPTTTTSGGVININPAGSAGLGAKNSGITFNFATGINALGFEVGDWATCCQPSRLYIQFGTNAPILVGSSTTAGDQFLTNGGAGVFVAAFDDTATFTQVSFWGDGIGEFLVAGGTIRTSALAIGSLPSVPEPATWAMMIAGFGLIGTGMRRRNGMRPILSC